MSGREEFEREKLPTKQGEPQAPKEAYVAKESFGGGGSKLPPSPARSPKTSPDYSEDIDTSLRQVTIHINPADWPDSRDSEGKGLEYVTARQTEVGYCSVTLKLGLSVIEGQLVAYIEADAKVGGNTLDYQAECKLFDLSKKHTFNRIKGNSDAERLLAASDNIFKTPRITIAIDPESGLSLPKLLETTKTLSETYFDTMLQLLGIKDSTSVFKVRPILPKQQSLAQKTSRFGEGESQGVAHLLQESEVRLSDIGGYHQVKGEIQKLIRLFKHQEHYESFGVHPPRGILFVGPPGTGKTTFAKAMCNELNINFYYVSTSDVLNCYYGESEKRIAEIFEKVKTPCVIFVDELEALAANRDNLSEPSKRVLTELLKKLDGMGSRSDILFLGATNKPDMLDPAITRSGRLDKTIVVGYPDEEARKETFEVYIRKYLELNKPELDCLKQLDTNKLARASQEYVGGDIKELMRRVVFSIADSALPDTTGTANKPTWQPTTEGVMSLIDQYQAELALKRGS